jgi:hypothetical protein
MSQQLQITGGAKVRDLQDVIIGTSGVLSSLAFNVANGVPKLDVNGKILVSQLPNSVMEYQGTWNAATNTPTLVNGVGNQGDVYLCNVAGTTNFGAGPITFAVGDSAIYSGTIWQRAGGATGTVTSVGLSSTGNDAITITASPVTTNGTINLGFAGTNLQYINGAGDLTNFPTLITSIGLSMPSAFNVSNSPLTANGTIGVTGAGYPSQYIRGDGTLADFPTSGGGGSSVSYYLNGGTSQGVIGGITYYEMSKIAVIGTGVDFPKSGDGLIVSFLTDAGDPAQLNIPAGNWNYEIYASMSSNGGTPQLYAELYVYDGTTFTLVATSSNEILYDGVNLNLYTFAMAIPATTLALTDRLAVKLYATNSGGKTTTVHTQNGHLCQIITTFSTGITALNGLTAQVQYFATGTSGTDFNISSSTATHTFNIPDASASARGLITTGIQTIAGAKTFTGNIIADGSVLLKNNVTSFLAGYVNLGGIVTGNGFSVGLPNGGSPLINQLIFNSSAAYNYTFPAASGTIALTSGLTGFVPYTGATANVDLGAFDLTAYYINGKQLTIQKSGSIGGSLFIQTGAGYGFGGVSGVAIASGSANNLIFNFIDATATNTKSAIFSFGSITDNVNRTYTLPDASGTLALTSDIPSLAGYVPYTGATQNLSLGSNVITAQSYYSQAGIFLSIAGQATSGSGFATINGGNTYLDFRPNNGGIFLLSFPYSTTRTFTLPDATGTIALTADLGSYLPLTGGTLTGGLGGTTASFTGQVEGSIINSTSNTFRLNGNNALSLVTLNSQSVVKINAAGFWGVQLVGANDKGILIGNTGNVCIGSTTINSKLDVASIYASDTTTQVMFRDDTGVGLLFGGTGGGGKWLQAQDYTGAATYYNLLLNPRGGSILIGVSTEDALGGITIRPTGTTMVFNNLNSAPTIMSFQYNSGVVGSITRTTSLTSYNVTSDYRLKQDFKDYNGLDLISAIKTYDYEWKSDNTRMYGVIAHELEEIIPYAVTGEKDAMNENGRINPQGVDYSKLVPVLVKAIQEQQALITSLQTRLDNAGL